MRQTSFCFFFSREETISCSLLLFFIETIEGFFTFLSNKYTLFTLTFQSFWHVSCYLVDFHKEAIIESIGCVSRPRYIFASSMSYRILRAISSLHIGSISQKLFHVITAIVLVDCHVTFSRSNNTSSIRISFQRIMVSAASFQDLNFIIYIKK